MHMANAAIAILGRTFASAEQLDDSVKKGNSKI